MERGLKGLGFREDNIYSETGGGGGGKFSCVVLFSSTIFLEVDSCTGGETPFSLVIVSKDSTFDPPFDFPIFINITAPIMIRMTNSTKIMYKRGKS